MPRPRIGGAGGYGRSHGQMRELLPVVALNGSGIDPLLAQTVIEQHTGAGPSLAVDEGNVRVEPDRRASGSPLDSPGHDQPLRTAHEREQHHGYPRQRALDKRHVVLTRGFVEQVRAGEMRLAAGQGKQTAQAADVGRRQPPAREALPQLLGQQVQSQIVAADGHQRMAHQLGGAVELDCYLAARLEPLLARAGFAPSRRRAPAT